MIANKYTILSKIGEGNFSTVYKGSKKNEDVAIKFENENSELKLLKHETSMLNYLYSKGSKQTPYVYFYGLHQNISTLIIPYYECSLEDYCENNEIPNNWFITMLETLHVIHHLGVIHRDIKPNNFLIGIKNNIDQIYIMDFGLSKRYCVNDKHIEIRNDIQKSQKNNKKILIFLLLKKPLYMSTFFPDHLNMTYWVPLPHNISYPSGERKIPECLSLTTA